MAGYTNSLLEKFQFQKPQINLARSSAVRMWLVNICAFMAIIQSSVSDSFSSLAVALGALIAAVLTEFLFLFKSGRVKQLLDGSAVATALILTLLLPNRISPLYAAVGAVFAIAVVKHSFGGLGSNWLNPAAGGWLFIRFSWPAVFNRALEGSPLSLLSEISSRGITSPEGSPLGILKVDAAELFAVSTPLDTSFRTFLNNTIFSFTGAELPGGYIDLFASRFPGIIADRGVLALLVGSIIITASRANRFWVPAVYVAVVCFLVRLAGALPYGGEMWNGDVFFALCSGGTLTAAFFLSSDPSTSAKSSVGILLATVAGGVICFCTRFFGAEPYGAVLAAVFINALLPLIRVLENRKLYDKRGIPLRSGANLSLSGVPADEASSRRYS